MVRERASGLLDANCQMRNECEKQPSSSAKSQSGTLKNELQELSSSSTNCRKRSDQCIDDFKENAVTAKKSRFTNEKTTKDEGSLAADNSKKKQKQLLSVSKEENLPLKKKRTLDDAQDDFSGSFKIAGRVVSVEMENFMCHSRLKIDFDVENHNCFYIGGPNGSGKSAIFAALNIGLGGRGSSNERGSSVKEYIKEGKNRSKIRIVLTNEGSGKHPSYGSEIAIERVISGSGSSYAVKSVHFRNGSRHEEVVTTKKTDLDRVLTRFDIQLTNPIFWMSQDRCRVFLQDMKPDKLYKVFMFATELDYTRNCYSKIEDFICDIRQVMETMKITLKQKKSQILALNTQKEKMKTIEGKKAKLNELGWILIWLGVRDADKEVHKWETAVCKIKQAVDNLHQRLAEFEDNLETLNCQQKKYNEEAEGLVHETDALKKKVGEKDIIVEDTRKAHTEKTQFIRKKEHELKEVVAQINSVDQTIRQMQARIQESKNGESSLPKLEDELRRCIQKHEELEILHSGADTAFKKCKSDLDEVMGSERKLLFDLRSADDALRKTQAERDRMEAISKSDVARFGVEVPAILNVIETNVKKFRKKPIGPLGLYVKVSDKRWTLAVELALANALKCFLCDNVDDKKLLERLLKKNGISNAPSFIVSRYSDHRYETKLNEPLHEHLTVLRTIEVSDDNIFNALVDQTQMESIILLETDDRARRVMYSKPPSNVHKGFTMNGSEVFPCLHGRAYRFYPNTKWTEAQFLASSYALDTKLLSTRIKDLEKQLRDVKEQHDIALKDVQEAKTRINMLREKVNDLSREIEKVLLMKRSLEKKIDLERADDNVDNQIVNLVSSKQEFQEKKHLLETTIAELCYEVDCCKKRYLESQAEKKAVHLELRTLENKLYKVKHKKDAVSVEREKLQDHKARVLNDVDKLVVKKSEYERHLDDAKMAYEKALEVTQKCASLPCPKGISNPPDLDSLPDSDATQQEYNNLEQFIKAAKQCLGSALITLENLENLTADFQKECNSYRQLSKLLKKLESSLELRQEKYRIIRHAIALRLCSAYSRLMGMRNFRGQLLIDHKERVIEVIAQTHQRNWDVEENSAKNSAPRSQNVGEMLRDLRGLSGGERTYTLACFLMALWEIMESPFRCMDEFDVFLDLNNRKLVMELLVDLATQQYPHNQFIFFTPQGITELCCKERVQLFQLPSARRQ